MERKCELCPAQAAIYCAADEAFVCWECDSHVHGANFLVARHIRAVLCRQCSAPTSWRASGARFDPTTYLCTTCQPDNLGSSESNEISDNSQTAIAVTISQSARVSDIARRGTDLNTRTLFSSSQANGAWLSSLKSLQTCKPETSSPECRPRSPVSVISSGRVLSKKRRTLVLEEDSAESSSDSDSEVAINEVTESRHSEDWIQIFESSFRRSNSLRRRSPVRIQIRTPEQDHGSSTNDQLNLLDLRRLDHVVGAQMESVIWDWHNHLNLRSPAIVALALQLLRRFLVAIKLSDMDGLDGKIFLAGCLWIAIKLHNPRAARSRSRLYEHCTGVPLRVLLAAEAHIYRVIDGRIDPESSLRECESGR